MTFGLYVNKADGGLDLRDNVFFNSVRHGILVQSSSNVNLMSNIVLGAKPRDGKDASFEKSSCYYLCPSGGCDNLDVVGNVAAGGTLGFIAAAEECTEGKARSFFYNNVAHSTTTAGWYVTGGFPCMTTWNFTGYRNAGVAITSASSAESLTLHGMKLADNGAGTSFTITNPDDTLKPELIIKESLYIGQSLHVHCTTDCTSADCSVAYGAVLGTF